MAVDPVDGRGAMAGGGAARHTGAVVPRPVLIGRLGGPARVTVVSGAAGSGKTVLLRSWIGGADLAALSELTRVLDGPLPVSLGFRVVTAYALEG